MPAVKNVGEPCAGEPHARFDGRREETRPVGPARAARPGASRRPYFVEEEIEKVAHNVLCVSVAGSYSSRRVEHAGVGL